LKEALKNLAMVSVPSLVLLLLLLEVVFRTAIPAASRPQAFFDAATSLWKLDRSVQAEGLATVGKFAQQRAHWRINNEGWNSPVDYATEKSRRRVAVIGDSYVEALQVDIEHSYPNLLASELGQAWDVYAFGVSGAPLTQYLHMTRYVVPRFSPDVLVLNLVHNDFTESYADHADGRAGVQWLRVVNGPHGLEEVPPAPDLSASQYSWPKRLLKRSALVRYLYYNLAIESFRIRLRSAAEIPANYNANVDVSGVQRDAAAIDEVVRYVFDTLRAENPDLAVIVVLDAPRPGIYHAPELATDLSFIADLVGQAAAANGFGLVDLAGPMRAEFDATGVPFETPYDGHWNELGHRFVAAQLLPLLSAVDAPL
jgi:hypothetical protein